MEGAQKVRARRTTPPVCVLAAHRGRTAAVGGSMALASFFFPLPFSSLEHFPLAPFSSLAHFGIKVSSDGRAQPWAAVGAAVTPRVDGGGGGAGRQGPARERVKRAHARRGRFPLRLLPLGRARSLWKLKVRAVEQADGVWRCSEAKPGLSRDLVRGRADVRAQSGVERSVRSRGDCASASFISRGVELPVRRAVHGRHWNRTVDRDDPGAGPRWASARRACCR